MFLLAMLVGVHSSLAVCPADAAALRADVQAAVRAYDDWAWEDFDLAVAALRADLGCLTEVLPSADAEAVHRTFALAGARSQDAGLAEAALRGLLAIEPGYEPEVALAPQGSLLRQAWESARVAGPGPGHPLPAGTWFVDGSLGLTDLPTERAALVQLRENGGGIQSWYLDGGDLPAGLQDHLAVAEPVAPVPEPVVSVAPAPAALPSTPPAPAVSNRGGHPSRALLVSGIAGLAAGVGGLVFSEACHTALMDANKEARAERYYHLGLASTFGGLALGATGSGLVVGAVVKGRW